MASARHAMDKESFIILHQALRKGDIVGMVLREREREMVSVCAWSLIHFLAFESQRRKAFPGNRSLESLVSL